MYADIDKQGKISIFEMTPAEANSLLLATRHYKDYCSNAHQLFSYRKDLKEDDAIMGRFIREIESVIHKEESNESRLRNK